MITWGSANEGSPLIQEDHKAFESALVGHAWARAFPGAIVVALIYDTERTELIDKLAEVAKGLSEANVGRRVNVLVSPSIPKESGIYSGWAAKNVWSELNKRSVE